MENKFLNIPLTQKDIESLHVSEKVFLSGTLYTARDAAHKRMFESLASGKELPFEIQGQTVYYMGPSPAREGRPIGSAGPTTSSRMDVYTPALIEKGMKGMIGKGKRSPEVLEDRKSVV